MHDRIDTRKLSLNSIDFCMLSLDGLTNVWEVVVECYHGMIGMQPSSAVRVTP